MASTSIKTPLTVDGPSATRLLRPLFPVSVPAQVRKLAAAAPKMEKSIFRKLVKVALAHLQRSQSEEECEAAFNNICTALNCTTEEEAWVVAELQGGAVCLLRALLRVNPQTARQQNLQVELAALGFRADQTADLCRVVFGGARASITEQLRRAAPRHAPALQELQWRVGLAPAPSSVPHIVEPVIDMTVKTTPNNNNSDKESTSNSWQFSLTLPQFQQLRHIVASSLQRMEELESLPGGLKYSSVGAKA